MRQAFFTCHSTWNWVLLPGLSQWSAQIVEVCETVAESSAMHRSSASTKAGSGMEASLAFHTTASASVRERERRRVRERANVSARANVKIQPTRRRR